ncbi:molybdopterin-dependent oxidoreductase [Devosia sp. SL43]|uniref:molybdopterin-dependent oxidoreductase n=1 Tax=Devosia sp. SL43 TaxID=2806348 RepID=UPI001F45095A|nr:molybdopterin-dependent oxidoreductase [Devosia sp. SL43]UJW85559.1 molybdopterin-dependent oxidoreductase [Devosia sp. SL43]
MRTPLASTLIALALLPHSVLAETLSLPSDPVVLTVSGSIANTNIEQTAQFDLAMLDALAQRTTVTETPWYDGEQTFSGPLAAALLKAVGAEGSVVIVTALNGYSAEIPLTDFQDSPVIFASRLNGEVLSVRDKGPLFVIYPFDAKPDLYNEVYFGRSVWQVTAISVQ